MRKLVYSKEAISNLKEIYDHLVKHFSEVKAAGVVKVIFHKISSLQEFPQLGKTSEISHLVRELTVEGNTVYYQLTEQTLDIIYVKPRKSMRTPGS